MDDASPAMESVEQIRKAEHIFHQCQKMVEMIDGPRPTPITAEDMPIIRRTLSASLQEIMELRGTLPPQYHSMIDHLTIQMSFLITGLPINL